MIAMSRAGAATGGKAGGKARRRATEPPTLQAHRYTILGGDGGLTRDNPLGRCIATVEYPRVVTVHWADELTGPTVARWDDWPWTERLLTIYGLLLQPRYLPAIRLDAIGFEVPWANRDIQGTMKPDAVIDLYRPLAHACNICIIDIQPAQARQALAGKGNATKDEVSNRPVNEAA